MDDSVVYVYHVLYRISPGPLKKHCPEYQIYTKRVGNTRKIYVLYS